MRCVSGDQQSLAGGCYWISCSLETRSEIPSFSFLILRVGRKGVMRYAVGELDRIVRAPGGM